MLNDATMAPLDAQWRPMTTDEFKGWFERLGLTQVELAKRLDTDQGRISRWLRGERAIPGHLWRALEHLAAELEQERTPKPKRSRRAARPAGEGESQL